VKPQLLRAPIRRAIPDGDQAGHGARRPATNGRSGGSTTQRGRRHLDGVLEAHAVDDSAHGASLGRPTGFRLCHWKELREAYHPATVIQPPRAHSHKGLHIRVRGQFSGGDT